MRRAKYTVVWRRSYDSEILTCTGLTIRQAAARLMRALRNSQSIEVFSFNREIDMRAGRHVKGQSKKAQHKRAKLRGYR